MTMLEGLGDLAVEDLDLMLDLRPLLVAQKFQIESGLEVDPELRRIAEEPGEPKRRGYGNSTVAPDDLADPGLRDPRLLAVSAFAFNQHGLWSRAADDSTSSQSGSGAVFLDIVHPEVMALGVRVCEVRGADPLHLVQQGAV